MFRRRSARLARSTHRLRHREIELHDAVVGLGAAVAASGRRRGRREQRVDLVHRNDSSVWSQGDCDTMTAAARALGSAIVIEREMTAFGIAVGSQILGTPTRLFFSE